MSDEQPLVIDAAYAERWRKTPEEVTELARDLVTNRVYLAVRPDMVEASFMILHFMQWMEDGAAAVGAVYEYMDKANPMSVNGYPSFFSARFVHRDDMDLLRSEVNRLAEALGLPVQPQKEQ